MTVSPPSSPGVDGILVVDKPPGITSMEVVRQVKRLTRVRRVGHGGTLDPGATGVLPVCFGQATRLMEYLIEGTKIYRARVRLGISTDTYDLSGTITQERDPSQVTREQAERELTPFTGTILQQPPMYSALKREGKRLYQLARAGIEVERPPRKVQVLRLELMEWTSPFFVLEVECGRGVYMRSLVHDLGEALGCGAHLDSLTRLRAGPLTLGEAISLERFHQEVEAGRWTSLLWPPDAVLPHMEVVMVDPRSERAMRNGQPAPLGPETHYASHLEVRRAYNTTGHFIAIVRFHKGEGVWQPEKVFQLPTPSPYAPPSKEM